MTKISREEMSAATENMGAASKALANAEALSRMGIRSNVAYATMIHHTAYQRWLAASAAFVGAR